ncbi:MAG TPA: glucose-1-phosphate thymidylyltransferase [Firmicutes bacterium]|nr:glucose-1-phosphate thymidylyltransferase [Bacillota bacterium]
MLRELVTYSEAEAFLFAGMSYPWQAIAELGSRLEEALPSGIRVGAGVILEGVFCTSTQVSIASGAVVEPTVVIQGGPVFVGEGAQIRAGAYIRGPAYIGTRAVVGHTTEVKNSILLAGAKAPHFNYVGDSLLGPGVNLGAGTKLGNVRLDEGEVYVCWQGNRLPSGLRKLGAILGDGCSLGCNSVCNPGTILYPGVHVWPGTVVSGTHRRGPVGLGIRKIERGAGE